MSGCGRESFALQVLGDSMLPEFQEGHIIIIDPDAVVENGSYVLAKYEGEYIFRKLLIQENQYFLKPLNEKYPVLPISGLNAIEGVIVQRAGTRRKEHKHYA